MIKANEVPNQRPYRICFKCRGSVTEKYYRLSLNSCGYNEYFKHPAKMDQSTKKIIYYCKDCWKCIAGEENMFEE